MPLPDGVALIDSHKAGAGLIPTTGPLRGRVWLFANGVICFQQGYRFFMIALKDEEDVNRIVREIKGLLPAGAPA